MLYYYAKRTKNANGRHGLFRSQVQKIVNGKIVGRYEFTQSSFSIEKLVGFLNRKDPARSKVDGIEDYLL